MKDKITKIRSLSDIRPAIEKYFYKIWESQEEKTQQPGFLEALVFLEFFIKKWLWTIKDIEWVYAKNFLIFNNKIFEFRDNTYQELQEKAMFVTSRDSWKNPFFLYIEKFFNDRVILLKPNIRISYNEFDKLTIISNIWNFREQYIWDMIIPFLRDKSVYHIKILLNFVQKNLGNQIVIKNNIGVEWKKVRALDLSLQDMSYEDIYNFLKKDYFDQGVETLHNPYIVKYYEISKEFRVYYTFSQDKGIEIYSVKNKENKTNIKKDIFIADSFSKEHIKISWSYMHPNKFMSAHKEVYDVCISIIPYFGLNTWVLEICQGANNDIHFIEVNPLWWALMFPWEDKELMINYTLDMWRISNLQSFDT